MNSKKTLKAFELSKSFKKKGIVQDISLKVNRGEIIGLLGSNGSGKTTSFYMIIGLIKPDKGKVLLDGSNITDLPMHKRARMGIVYLPQETSVFRDMTVEENILCALEALGLNQEEISKRLRKILDEFDLNSIAKQKAYTLSGGQRRRVEVSRAVAFDPAFLLLDEPFSGVDPISIGEIQKIIQDLKEKNIGILITDHNVRETLSICDFVYLIDDGQMFETGTPTQIANSEKARKKYLGDNFEL